MLPELYFIIALFTGGIHQEYFKFDRPIFHNEKSCITYVKKQFKKLNLLVNKKYKANPINEEGIKLQKIFTYERMADSLLEELKKT